MSDSKVISKGPCTACGSSDANHHYDDGHSYCFAAGCETYTHSSGAQKPNNNKRIKTITTGTLPELPTEFSALKDRAITAETCKKYGVTQNLGTETNIKHIYPYYDEKGTYVAAKARTHVKGFMWKGDAEHAVLFGQQLFPPNSAKYITIVEGELDAMSSYQIQGSRYPVVSVKSASVAVKDCVKSFKYLSSFDNIVVCFDADEGKINPATGETRYPGQEAASAVAKLFPIGKVKVVTLNKYKDSSDYLMAHEHTAYMKEWWDAPTYTPTGLVHAKDMWTKLSTPKVNDAVPYPWEKLQQLTYGMRKSEMVTITAETGIGKTSLLKELQHHILTTTETEGVGILHLEEPNDDTALGLMSITANKPLHLPDTREAVSVEELKEYFDVTLNNDRVVMWDHFGSNSIDEVIANIRFMANMGCSYIFLDHLSILVSDQNGDERKQLDEAATKLKTLCMELNIALFCVIHQNRNGQIRGTAGVEQLSNMVIKITRDKKAKDAFVRNTTTLEVEKNRFCGRTGPGGYLFYEPDTGRLRELSEAETARFEGNAAPEEFTFKTQQPTPEETWDD